MRSVVRRFPALLVLTAATAAGCATARPDAATPAAPAAAATATTRDASTREAAARTPGAAGATTTTAAAGAAATADAAAGRNSGSGSGGSRIVSTSLADADATGALGALGAGGAPASRAVAQFRAEAAAAFADPSVNALWGVEIQSLDTGELLYAQNPHALMMPASNMKIVTMSIAAARLGWDYRFTTTVEADGPIANGTLAGDLVVVGSGDPTISDRGGPPMRVFESWADQLRAAGITRIAGRIIGDDDRFDDRPLGEGWAWDDLNFSYSAAGGALQFNEDIVSVIITPGATAGQPATVRLEPEGSGLVARAAVATRAESTQADVSLSRERNSTTLFVSGTVPANGKEITRSAAVDNPTIFFVNALRATLIRKGIEVTGTAMDIDDLPRAPVSQSRSAQPSARAGRSGGADRGGAAPQAKAGATASARRVLLTHQSPPLSEIGTTFMKVSQNLFGETLMALIGERAVAAQTQSDSPESATTPEMVTAAAAAPPPTPPGASRAAGAAGTAGASAASATAAAAVEPWPVPHGHVEAARKVYEQMLGSWGVPRGEFVLVDGSGLSRYNLVTPHMLTRILRRMARDTALGATFEATLPIGGKDGTLGPRMKGTKSENNVHAKTGSLAGVRALSGYLRTADGERIVFSILANNFNAPTAAVDAITDHVLERLANFTRQP